MKELYLSNMRFVEELLYFLCKEKLFGFQISWQPKLSVTGTGNEKEVYVSELCFEIGCAMYHIIHENAKEIQECFGDFFNNVEQQSMVDDINAENFAKCVLKVASSFFSKGYSHRSFLAYFAIVIGVAYNFLLLKPNCIPQRACQIVAHVLSRYQITGQFYEEGGWKCLKDTASSFNDSMKALNKNQNKV